jgi:hypothetical protein
MSKSLLTHFAGEPLFTCQTHLFKLLGLDCMMPAVKKKPIEALVWEKIVEIVMNPELIRDVNPKNWTDPLASIIMWKKSRIGGYHVHQTTQF